MIRIQKSLHYHLIVIKVLIEMYIIKLSKHKIDKPRGTVSNIVGVIITILFSLSVQLTVMLFVVFKSVILS